MKKSKDLHLNKHFFIVTITFMIFALNNGCKPTKNIVNMPVNSWYECTIINKTLYELLKNVVNKDCDSALYYSIVFSYDSIEPSIDVYKICKSDDSSIDEYISLVGTREYVYCYNTNVLVLIQTEYTHRSDKLKKFKERFIQRNSITVCPNELNDIPIHRRRIHVAKYDNL